jgi:hypothetical protein
MQQAMLERVKVAPQFAAVTDSPHFSQGIKPMPHFVF